MKFGKRIFIVSKSVILKTSYINAYLLSNKKSIVVYIFLVNLNQKRKNKNRVYLFLRFLYDFYSMKNLLNY